MTSTTSTSSSSSLNLTINYGVPVSLVDLATTSPANNNQLPTNQYDQSAIQLSLLSTSSSELSSPPNDADDQSKDVVVDDQQLLLSDNLDDVKDVKVTSEKPEVQISNNKLPTTSNPTTSNSKEITPSNLSSKKSVSSSIPANLHKSLSPSPNFPQMVFSFLPLSTAVETTLKATNFAASALSKAMSTSSLAHSVSSSISSSSESSDDQMSSQPKLASQTELSSSTTSSSAALPYVHLPGVHTALDQAVQEYDVLLSENGAVAFMRPNFAPKIASETSDLFPDDTRLVEVKVLTKEALLNLASSPPLGYLSLMEALKTGSPVPMKQLKASSFARLLNSVEAVFTKASDLVEATSGLSSEGDEKTVIQEVDGDGNEVLNLDQIEQRTSSSSFSSVIIMADDALSSMEHQEMITSESRSSTILTDDKEENHENLCDDHACDKQDKDKLPDQKSDISTTPTFTTSPENSNTDKVIVVENLNELEDDDEEGERNATSLPTVVLLPPTPQPPSLSPSPSVPVVNSFLHGPRSKRFAHLSGIELLSMPAREKSASTPSLISNASSEASYNSSFSNHKSSFSSVKSDNSETEKEKEVKGSVLPGDDFEDIKVEDSLSIKSGNSETSVVFPLISAENDLKGNLAQQSAVISTSTPILAPVSGGHSGHKRRPSTLIQIHNPSYKARCEDFEAIFGAHGIPPSERLIADFSCAYYKSILIQGRIYITKHFFAFYANWVGLYEKYMIIKIADVQMLVKANTMVWIPNAIHITTADGEKHIFASFGARDRAFEVMSTVWKAVKEGQVEAEEVGEVGVQDEAKEEVNSTSTNSDVTSGQSGALNVEVGSEQVIANDGINGHEEAMACELSNQPVTMPTSSYSPNSTLINTIEATEQPSSANITSHHSVSSSSSKLSDAEMWKTIKEMYGDNLGLSRKEEAEISGEKASKSKKGKKGSKNSSPTAGSSALEAGESGQTEVANVNSIVSTPSTSSGVSSPPKSKVHFKKDKLPKATSSSSAATSSHSPPTTKDVPKNQATMSTLTVTITSPENVPKQDVQAKCPCTDAHYGAIVISKTYPVSVDVLFELLYAEAKPPEVPQSDLFTEQFLRSRGTKDLKMTPWRLLATQNEVSELAKSCKDLGLYGDLKTLFGSGNGELLPVKSRNLEYTFELNHVLCKSCYTRERQFILAQKRGNYYVILSEAKNEGPPFSDSFVVCSTMCLTSAGNGSTKLTVQYKLCWIKSSFSMRMLTGTIERSSKEGFTEIANDKLKRMEMHLKIVPADEHFLTTLAACSPEMAASFASNGSALSGSPDISANVAINSGLSSSPTTDLSPQVLGTSTLPANNQEVSGDVVSGQQTSVVNPISANEQTSSTNSRFGLIANVNLLLIILVIFTVAYVVLINRVWAMEERMDMMAEYIGALMKDDGEGGDDQAGQPSTRMEL